MDNSNSTAYRYFGEACAVGHVDSVLYFLLHPSSKLDPTYQHTSICDGYSPLMRACMNGQTDIVCLLILLSNSNSDADALLSPTISQKLCKSSLSSRRNAFDLAAIHGYTKVLSILSYFNSDLVSSYMQKMALTYQDIDCHKNTISFLEDSDKVSPEALRLMKSKLQQVNNNANGKGSNGTRGSGSGRGGRGRGGRWFDFDFDFSNWMPHLYYIIPRVTGVSFFAGTCLTWHYILSLQNSQNDDNKGDDVNTLQSAVQWVSVLSVVSQLVLYVLIYLTRATDPGFILTESAGNDTSKDTSNGNNGTSNYTSNATTNNTSNASYERGLLRIREQALARYEKMQVSDM